MIAQMAERIDLGRLTKGEVFNLAGHDRGVAARELFELSRLDDSDEDVLVEFPSGFRGVSSSFFQGMFAESVRRFNGARQFFEHYRFDAPAHIRARLIEYAEQVAGR